MAQDRVWLVGAEAHPHAARRLATWRSDLTSAPVDGPPDQGPFVRLVMDPALPEGAYVLEREGPGIQVRGGPVSGVIQGTQRLLRELGRGDAPGVMAEVLSEGSISAAPAFPIRALWVWDHSTNWVPDALGAQDTGAFNPYNRQPGTFLADLERLVDHASTIGVNAVIVYGLLRDSHGGVDAARDLCRLALRRGVRVIAGIGINAYGATYWEGDQRYNLATWLRAHPELAAQAPQSLGFSIPDYGHLAFPRSDYLAVACPSRPENARFHEEAVTWLVETLEVGGVNFEAGDYGGCACDVCERERGSAQRDRRIADQYARLFDIVATSSRDLPRWSLYEVYTDNLLDPATREAVAALPDAAAYQYTVNRSYWPRVREAVAAGSFGRLPHSRNILRTHVGSQWNRQRHAWVGPVFAEMAGTAARVGMSGMTIFGEASAYHPPNELNYAAFARYTWDPDLPWDRFRVEEVDPRLGGDEPASRFIALLDLVGDGAEPPLEALGSALDEVRAVGRSLAGEVARRWLWLEERLARCLYVRGGGPP